MSGATSQGILHIPTDEDPGVLRRRPAPDSGIDAEQNILLLQELQTTLELAPLLELFLRRLRERIRLSGLLYLPPGNRSAQRVGSRASHQCAYELLLHDQPLGEIVFLKRRPFAEREIRQLENALALLMHPLRNALLYLDAMEQARRDALTGIGNRAAMEESLSREISLAQRHGSTLSIVLFDIDHFKRINDTWGHACGDQVLRAFAAAAQSCIRASDDIFRYGGEEFLLLLRNTHLEGATRLATRIRRHLERSPLECAGQRIQVTTSAGVAAHDGHEDPARLVQRADRALYLAKQRGRNRVEIAQDCEET